MAVKGLLTAAVAMVMFLCIQSIPVHVGRREGVGESSGAAEDGGLGLTETTESSGETEGRLPECSAWNKDYDQANLRSLLDETSRFVASVHNLAVKSDYCDNATVEHIRISTTAELYEQTRAFYMTLRLMWHETRNETRSTMDLHFTPLIGKITTNLVNVQYMVCGNVRLDQKHVSGGFADSKSPTYCQSLHQLQSFLRVAIAWSEKQ